MKTVLLSFCVLITSIGITQITITNLDFASAGDTAMVSFSSDLNIDLATNGADVIWNFSNINITAQSIDTFKSVSSADLLLQLAFNNFITNPDNLSDWYTNWSGGGLTALSQYGVDVEEPVQFTAVYSDRVENTGFGFYIQGTAMPAKSDTVDVQYQLPINYSDSWSGSSYTYLDLNPAFDAIWIRYEWRNSIVDAWGEITTPFGTYDVIRVKSQVTSLDSLWAGMLSTWFELPTPDEIEYEWFANGEKLPVFSVTTADVGGTETITEIKFKDKKRNFASTEELSFEGSIYPNPVTSELAIQLTSIPQYIEVFDISGQLIYSVIPNAMNVKLDVSDWDAGIYILKVNQIDGVASTKFVVE